MLKYDLVKILLEDGRTDPVRDNCYPLRTSSQQNDIPLTTLILKDKRVQDNIEHALSVCGKFNRYGKREIIKQVYKQVIVDELKIVIEQLKEIVDKL